MTDSPTLKAFFSTLLIFVIIFSVSAMGSAIGQDTEQAPSSSTVSPYTQTSMPAQRASHNQAQQPSEIQTQVGHNQR